MHRLQHLISLMLVAIIMIGLGAACNPVVQEASCSQIVFTLENNSPATLSGDTVEAWAGSSLLGTTPVSLLANSITTISVPLSPVQPNGTTVDIKLTSIGLLFSVTCSGEVVTRFNPGDNRVDPQAGDRLAAYCNLGEGTIGVYIVKPDSSGELATTFNYLEVRKASSKGIYVKLSKVGIISLAVDGQDNFWLAWNGGRYGADGQPQHGFAKGFYCDFSGWHDKE